MLPGETHRERVLTAEEEKLYFTGASSDVMMGYRDTALLRDVATILLECALRPEECFRLRVENVVDGNVEEHFGKTDNARRRIPMTPRVKAVLDMRLSNVNGTPWVFPAETKSGHIEPSSLKKQHAKAIEGATRALRKEFEECSTTSLGGRGAQIPLDLLNPPRAISGPDYPALVDVLLNLRQPLDWVGETIITSEYCIDFWSARRMKSWGAVESPGASRAGETGRVPIVA
jgi:hypothetical protein